MKHKPNFHIAAWFVRSTILLMLVITTMIGLAQLSRSHSIIDRNSSRLESNLVSFGPGFTPTEEQQVQSKIASLKPKLHQNVSASLQTTSAATDVQVLGAYVAVSSPYGTYDSVERYAAAGAKVLVDPEVNPALAKALAQSFGLPGAAISPTADTAKQLLQTPTAIAIIPAAQLSPSYKLLRFGGVYYLDSFSAGAVFRTVSFSGPGSYQAKSLTLAQLSSKADTLKVNMSGVVAMARDLLLKIRASGDGAYPAKNIASFLSDADLTHVSNEVSFLTGCQYSLTIFCAPPESIKALEAVGTDVIELTGNHNNDVGSGADTATVNAYHQKGWGTFGGGLNTAEAAQPYLVNQKKSRVAFLGYNYYDTIHRSAALAGTSNAGANSFDFDKIKRDIVSAKSRADVVVVDVQYQECYAYPASYVLAASCYKPIGNPDQTVDFRRIADLGASMVVGTQAHQPQTFELYHEKPIYYGLGNLFFDQFEWPGTEQGMILTHYIVRGKLVQTKLSPTVYDRAMQTRLMTEAESESFLGYLGQARAGL